jgi:hypothetical protein
LSIISSETPLHRRKDRKKEVRAISHESRDEGGKRPDKLGSRKNGSSLGLGDEEVHPGGSDKGNRTEEDVRSKTKLLEHLGRDLTDDEVVHPVGRRADGHALGSDAHREDLGDEDPSGGSPRVAGRVENGERTVVSLAWMIEEKGWRDREGGERSTMGKICLPELEGGQKTESTSQLLSSSRHAR